MNQGSITFKFTKSTSTKYAAMAGVRLDNKLIFECCQIEEGERNIVEVQGLYPTPDEETAWIKPIFEDIWQGLLERFPKSH